MRYRFLIPLVITLLMAVPALAGDEDVIGSWKRRMAESDAALQTQDYSRALKLANRTVSEMVELLGPGEGSTQLFTNALLQKALAHGGAGEIGEAIWYWHIALAFNPSLADTDLSAFGEPGQLLLRNREPLDLTSSVTPDDAISPPKVVKRRKPKFPHGALYYGVTGKLVVEVIVGSDGMIRAPRIVSPLPAPTLSYAALEAVKYWRFEPARVGDQPVDLRFNLTVNYKD